MNKPKLNQLEMLVAVADTGGFGAAAAQLECTQSRISHGITELEATLGARLLIRSRTGCVPTQAGQRVLATARHMLRLASGLRNDAAPGGDIAGHVRIACFRSIATHVLPHTLEALASAFPGIRVDIDDSFEEREAVATAVREGRADIGIAQLPVAAELVAHDFVADAYVLVVPASLRLQLPVSWDQLKDLNYLQLNCSGALAILAQCRKAGFNAQPSRLLTTDSSIVAMVRQGLGFTILPRLAVFPLPDGVNAVPLPFAAKRSFAVVALPEVARTEAANTVIAHIRNRKLVARSEAFGSGLLSW
jgi:DNA-binding transcriptional LysR family regulator